MKRLYTRTLSLLMALCMLVSLVPISASANSSTITIDGSIDYERAFAMLDSINEIRVQNGSPALVMDQGLMDGAILRSAEHAVAHSLIRPDGDMFLNAYPYGGGYNCQEYSAVNQTNEYWLRNYKND